MPADILKVVNIWKIERQNFRLPNRAEQARPPEGMNSLSVRIRPYFDL
jgi:hypothetical protein